MRIDAREQRLFYSFYHLGRIDLGFGDFASNFLLFVSEEVVRIALARHVVLANQAVERRLHLFAQGNLVNTHIVGHQNGEVVHRGLDVVDVSNKVEQLEQAHVFGHKAAPGFGGFARANDHLGNAVVEVFRNGVEETPERHKRGGVFALHRLRRFLKRRKHAAFAG